MNAPLPMRAVTSVARERPLDGRLHVRPIAPGERLPTLAEILAELRDLPDGFATACEARINDQLIPRGIWHLVRPRPSPAIDIVVSFTLPLRGGGGAGGASSAGGGPRKNPVALVATIAVLLVAAAVSGGALGIGAFVGGVLGTSAAVGGSVAAAAIGIAGSLAIAALSPPPSLANGSASSPAGGANALPASLTGNVLSPGAPIPRVIGEMRVFPPLACRPLVEVIGDREYAEAVMVLAGPHALSDLRVGGVNAADIAELDHELQEGLQDSPRQSLVSRYGYTIEPGIDLVGHTVNPTTQYYLSNQADPEASSPQWHTIVAQDSPDEVWINLAWPEGLSATAVATIINQAIRIRFRERGDVSWINCPEIHVSSNYLEPFQKVIRFKWGTIPVAPNLPPANRGPIYAFKEVPQQSGATPVSGGWSADSYFDLGSGDDYLSAANLASSGVLNTELHADKVVFYLDEATFPKGIYEFQVMRSQPFAQSTFAPSTYIYSGAVGSVFGAIVYDFFGYYDSGGVHRLISDMSLFRHRLILSRVASVWNENPIQSDDFATVSIRVHSRALAAVSVLAAGYVRDWDGSAWADLTTTSNPAPHFYDVLTGTLGGRPIPAAIADSAGLVAWRTACTSAGYTVNAVVDGRLQPDVLDMIAACGYARKRQSELWGVMRDYDRSAETPVQIFTPRNMRSFAWTRAFADRPSGFRANFINADLDYAEDEVIVYDDPVSPDGSRLEQIRYDGLIDTADVEARARFDLDQSNLRFTFYRGETDIESLVCVRGDLVGVQHDILAAKAGFARIKSIVTSGGNVTGLVLEGTVPVTGEDAWSDTADAWSSYSSAWSVARWGIAIRYKGGNGIVVKEVDAAADETDTVTFVTPFADPGAASLDIDCLCATGPLGSEYQRLIVAGMVPTPEQTIQLILVDEAPELHA